MMAASSASYAAKLGISTPRKLYKYLLTECRKLPSDAQPYYKNYVRQGFNSHSDENDPERIQQILDRAVEDAKWIIKKYSK